MCDRTVHTLHERSAIWPKISAGHRHQRRMYRTCSAAHLNCSVEDFLSVEERFDVISMWHLVEHLPDPKPFFEHAFKLLQPGGLFLVETPIAGIVAKSFASAWRFLMPVEHLNLFSQSALFTLATKCGFNIRSFVSFGSGNTSDTVPDVNKRAMDTMVKQLGCGDVLAVLFTKPPVAVQARG